MQCFGSRSLGSVCSWPTGYRSGSIIYLFRYGPAPNPNPSINKQKWRKNLDFYCLWLLYDFLSLKNDVNVFRTFKKEKHKQKKERRKKLILLASWGSLKKRVGSRAGSVSQRYGSGDPDTPGSVPKCHRSGTLLIWFKVCSPCFGVNSNPKSETLQLSSLRHFSVRAPNPGGICLALPFFGRVGRGGGLVISHITKSIPHILPLLSLC
jgi:hypothetical protein